MFDNLFDNLIDEKRDIIIDTLSRTIEFPSVSVETDDPTKPFGEDCKNVLNYILDLGKQLGFRVKNIDGYCGYLEFGEGEEMLGIIGHLDVVPADNNWTYSPFKATIKDGKLYGRGAIDDKGPVVASIYAMKAVMDTVKVHKRVRLILGLNEETNWKCINYYKAHEESPTLGFSPDADFPCIYAEKGILSVFIKQNLPNIPLKISNIDTNNNAINVVSKYCKVTLSADHTLDIKELYTYINKIIDNKNLNISSTIEDNVIQLVSNGIAAHAAHPDLGINAISHMLVLLQSIYEHINIKYPIIDFFNKYIGTEYDGKSLGINLSDESGSLTLNVGKFLIDENSISIGLNLRIPVTISLDTIASVFYTKAQEYSNEIEIQIPARKAPLYIDKNNNLVQNLCNIFNESTNMNEKPIAIGGATYARAFDNCISFGANFPGDKDMCHQVDEFIYIDKLILSSKIYAKAIYELSK